MSWTACATNWRAAPAVSGATALGGYRAAPAPGPAGGSDLAAQLLQRVTQLEDEVRRLRGRVDEADNARQRQGEDLSKEIADLNFRLDGSGGGARQPSAPPAAPAPAPQAAPAPPAPPPVRRTPEVTMQEGNAALARRDYAAAEAAAREVLAGPRTPRSIDANFLLAQALAGRKDWPRAAVAYDDTYNRSKTGAHAGESLLRAGGIVDQPQREQGRLRNTRQAPRRVSEPAAGAARSGRRRPAARRLSLTPLDGSHFAALMAPLGPFEPAPHLCVAVSGGADSMALALLAQGWARARGGRATALVVDHGLRPGARAEAEATLARLGGIGLAAELLTLDGLVPGPALAARARTMRHAALAAAARRLGVLHLLFAHHAGDQAETVAMRRLAGSGAGGLAGMAALSETEGVRLLRPLLTVPPARLRATLRQAGLAWVEDPSNDDPAALRARLRRARGDAAGAGVLTRAAVEASLARGRARAAAERLLARELAARVELHPEGYAVLGPEGLSAPALACLLRTLAGAPYAPAPGQVAALAAALRPATLGGVRVLRAGRLGPGWLLTREPAALGPPVPAGSGAVWDGRFRLAGPDVPPDAWIGPLGGRAKALRALPGARAVPASVLATLPSVWLHDELFDVPHLGYRGHDSAGRLSFAFVPSLPLAGAPFAPASGVAPGR